MIQFEKLQSNLWLLRWLRPSHKLVRNFKPVGLWTLKIGFDEGQPIFNKEFLKDNSDFALQVLMSSLFHSQTE